MSKAIIFDFDGVLVESELPRFNILKKILLKENYELKDSLFPKIIGKPGKTFLNEIFGNENGAMIDRVLENYKIQFINCIEDHIIPINPTISFIKNYNGCQKIAIASMNVKDVIVNVLKKFSIVDKFDLILSRDDVKHHKPNPEIYTKISHEFNLPPEECSVIEDSIVGVNAVINAGMKCYVLLNTFNNKAQFSNVNVAGFIETTKDFEKYF